MDSNPIKTLLSILPENKNKNIKISSVLNKDATQYGKLLMFDGNEDSCWNSDQGNAQYILVLFDNLCNISEINITGSGGFCPKVFI